MTLFESIMIFLTVVCVFVCIGKIIKEIDNLRYNINRIREVSIDFAGIVDGNFDIQSAEINELKGPTYGPMIEEGEEYTE